MSHPRAGVILAQEIGVVFARGYLRLLTTRSDPRPHLPTCLGDTTPRILDSPLDVSPPESDEWCGRQPPRRPGCPTP